MLQVYAIPESLYAAKLRILLRHKGLEWEELAPPGGFGSAEYGRIVPSRTLPALRDGDLLLGDSEAIAEYLQETHPRPAMLPGGAKGRARARERGRFHDTRLEPEVRRLFAHLPGRDAAPKKLIATQSVAISDRLAQLAALLEISPAKKRLTLGDCGYPITFAWLDLLTPIMGLEIGWPDTVTAYRRRIEAHDAVKAELAEYRPRLKAFLGA